MPLEQDPLTTLLAQEDIYKLPLVAKKGLARYGGENRAFAQEPVEVGSPAGDFNIARTGVGGTITINPAHPLISGGAGDMEDIADVMAHEQKHRDQNKQKGLLRASAARIRENLLQLLGIEPYGEGPLESEGFQAAAERSAKRGYFSPFIPTKIMQGALDKRQGLLKEMKK